MISMVVSFIWGLMEALWFFVVPDIGLSYFALKGWKVAIRATLFVILGAMLGAGVLFLWFISSPDAASNMILIWSKLPGFYPEMLKVVAKHIQESGAKGFLSGPSSGIPYRFYVLEALVAKISLLQIWIWTPLARLQRIVLAPAAVLVLNWMLRKTFLRWYPQHVQQVKKLMIVFISIYWVGIYIWYWGIFLPALYAPPP